GVDRQQLEVTCVEPGPVGHAGGRARCRARDRLGLRLGIGGEPARDREVVAKPGEVVGQLRGGGRQPERGRGPRRRGRRAPRATVAPTPSGSCASTKVTASAKSSTTETRCPQPNCSAWRRTATNTSGVSPA